MSTLISVVIPAYKRPELLKQAVESVIAQTHRPLELVIVNDGSPDDTAAQMEAMRPAVETAGITASFHSKENGGVASARNYGMQRATGDYVALLDADDLYFPTKLEKQLAAVITESADASSCLVERRIGERVSLYPSDAAGLLSGHNPGGVLRLEAWTHTNSLFLSRKLLDRAGLYDERLEIFEDDEFLIRLAHHGKFAAVPEALATWIDQPESLSQVPDYATLMMRDRNRRKQLDITREVCSDQPGWDESAWKRSVDRWYKQIINHYIWANDLKGATENLEAGVERAGWLPLLKRSRKKLRKAKFLRLIGLRIKNPKNDPIYDQT